MNKRSRRRSMILAGVALGVLVGNVTAFVMTRNRAWIATDKVVPPPPPSEERVKAMNLREQGLAALKARDYDAASKHFLAALDHDASNSDIPILLELASRFKDQEAEKRMGHAVQEAAQPLAPKSIEEEEPSQSSRSSQPRPRREPRRESTRETPQPESEPESEPAVSLILVTTTPPKLTIRIDGETKDMSPARIEVTPGQHRIEILSGERILIERQMDVPLGEAVTFTQDLTALLEPVTRLDLARQDQRLDPGGPIGREGVRETKNVDDGQLDLVRLMDPNQEEDRANVDDGQLDLVRLAERTDTENATGRRQAHQEEPPETWPSERPTLFVYLPGFGKSLVRTLQANLRGVEVDVFSERADLEERLASQKPDAVLSTPAVLEDHGMHADLHGKRSTGAASYVLLGVGEPLDPTRLGSAKIGVVDTRDRKQVERQLSRLLGGSVRLKRVTKLEDLLPLLQFKQADAVLIKSSDTERFRRRTAMDLKATTIEGRTSGDQPAVAFLPGGRRAPIEESILALGESALGEIGVDSWVRK